MSDEDRAARDDYAIDELPPKDLRVTLVSFGSGAVGLFAGFGLAAAFTMVSAAIHTPHSPQFADTFALVGADTPSLPKEDKSLAPIRLKTIAVAAAPMPGLAPGPAAVPATTLATAAPEDRAAQAPADDEDEPLPASKNPHHAEDRAARDICSRHGGYRVEITVRHGWHSWRCKFAKGGR